MTTAHQAKIEELHRTFCGLTGRTENVRYHDRSWHHLLHEVYQGDDARMKTDLELIVRYLRIQISQGRRNNGALKLFNFLQPDKWDADLAEARVVMKPRKPRTPASAVTKVAEAEDRPGVSIDAVKQGVDELRKRMRGGQP